MTSNNNTYKEQPLLHSMANTLVSVRIPEHLFKESMAVAQQEGYVNVQEFIREALRMHTKEQQVQHSLKALDQLAGSAKHIKSFSRKEIKDHLARVYAIKN